MKEAINFSVVLEMHSHDMIHAFSELAGCCGIEERDAAVRLLVQREELGSTAIGNGVAVPHAKIGGIAVPHVVVGISRSGIDFSGASVSVILMLLLPESETSSDVALLSQLVSRISAEEGRARLLAAGSKAEVEEVFLG